MFCWNKRKRWKMQQCNNATMPCISVRESNFSGEKLMPDFNAKPRPLQFREANVQLEKIGALIPLIPVKLPSYPGRTWFEAHLKLNKVLTVMSYNIGHAFQATTIGPCKLGIRVTNMDGILESTVIYDSPFPRFLECLLYSYLFSCVSEVQSYLIER